MAKSNIRLAEDIRGNLQALESLGVGPKHLWASFAKDVLEAAQRLGGPLEDEVAELLQDMAREWNSPAPHAMCESTCSHFCERAHDLLGGAS